MARGPELPPWLRAVAVAYVFQLHMRPKDVLAKLPISRQALSQLVQRTRERAGEGAELPALMAAAAVRPRSGRPRTKVKARKGRKGKVGVKAGEGEGGTQGADGEGGEEVGMGEGGGQDVPVDAGRADERLHEVAQTGGRDVSMMGGEGADERSQEVAQTETMPS